MTAPDPARLIERRAEVVAQIEALAGAEAPANDPSHEKRRRVLERLERLLAQLVGELQRGEKLGTELAQERQASSPALPDGGPPYSVRDYDAAHASVEEVQRLFDESSAAVIDANNAAASARETFERRQREVRGADAPGPLAVLQLDVAKQTLALRRAQLENARQSVKLTELQLARRREALDRISTAVQARPGEREAVLSKVDDRAAVLERRRTAVETELAEARLALERAEGRLLAKPAEPALRAEREIREAEVRGLQKRAGLLAEQIDRLERAHELAERRFALFSGDRPERATLSRWRTEAVDAGDSLAREARLDQAEVASLTQELADLDEAEGGSAAARAGAIRATIEAYNANLETLESALRRERLLQDAVSQQLGSVALRDRLESARAGLGAAWNFEVTASEDRSVTVGKIVIALVAFVLGILLARLVTQWAGGRLLARVGVDEGAAHAYQSLAYYTLVAIAFLVALRSVDIPLTAFAVVGGALAIGIGFGSQNIVNNFISGVILLAERPIKRGDLVDVEGTFGNVERIGLRSTSVRTGDNIHVIVPNSAFLENKVINWTHNDANVRLRLRVGVIYGSPTRDVQRLIKQAVVEHERVLDRPAPILLFVDFGDDSLIFEVLFWARVKSMLDRARIESDLRFRIDDLFREAGLVIAFPQRDVHLDAASPIPIELVSHSTGDDGAGLDD